MKKGDLFKLECGHEGRVIWISSDKAVVGVRGSSRSCQSCGKKTSGGWVSTVYLFSVDEVDKSV